MNDYYAILGLSKNDSSSDIKAAYRRLALQWHPDRNKSAEAAEKFKTINQAYEVLSDHKKKDLYDQVGHEAFTRQGFGRPAGGQSQGYQSGPFTYTYSSSGGGSPFENFDFGGFSDPFEIFEQFFGVGGRRGTRQQRSAYQIAISFNEAVHGVTKDVQIEGKQKSIKIPAGVDDGMRIRFSDFDLLISVRSDPRFKRQGQDIYLEMPISITTAILGGVATVPSVNESIKVKVRPGTQSGTTIRLRGQGIVYPNSSRRGDQYVVFTVKIPDRVNARQKKLLEELQKEFDR